jgi:Fe-S cluster biogenesis protein NfuA
MKKEKEISPNEDPGLIERIENTLATLRPYLEADSGDVSFIEVTDKMIVRLEFLGACSSCSMSSMTLKAGIEQSLLKSIPELKGVEAINA